jgi:hypothetical protein
MHKLRYGSILGLAAVGCWLTGTQSSGQGSKETSPENLADDQERATEALLSQCGVPYEAIKRMKIELRKISLPGWEYPWRGLEEAATAMPNNKFPLVGYGSLLNRESAGRSVKEVGAEKYSPVVTLGALRVFNYVIQESMFKFYRRTSSPLERAALNVLYTKSPAHAVNGRLLMVEPNDLAALREREFGYDLRPVSCLRWLDWNGAAFVAYILVAANSEVGGRRVIDDSILPNPSYYRVCREGAIAVSESFLQLYLYSTFLGDKKTALAAWERDHPGVVENPDSD